jgi:hypothetical protein
MGVTCQLGQQTNIALPNLQISSRLARLILAAMGIFLFCLSSQPVSAQVAQSEFANLPLLSSAVNSSTLLAQAPPTMIPTDITPSALGQKNELSYSPLRFKLFSMLPERLWFDVSNEVSQRVETNVFFTETDKKADYVFRELPNVSLGYNLFNHTSIYCNYFVIKDVFAVHNILTPPTTQSVALGFRHDIMLGSKTNIQLDFQSRELWQARNLRQADLLPNISVSRLLPHNVLLFGSALLQLRGNDYFTGANREIDPFFTLGAIYRRGNWSFSASTTYVNNFRRHATAIPPQSNQTIISDYEISRPINKKFPGFVYFVRAEPIWNWGAHGTPGLSGFDFRCFGGIRMAFSKPAFNSDINKLHDQILEEENSAKPSPQVPNPAPEAPNSSMLPGAPSYPEALTTLEPALPPS